MADFDWWRAALAGEKPRTYEAEPECGYFKMRDRRGLNKDLAPIKRPWIACAIWRDLRGHLNAELAGSAVDVDRIWPWVAKYPVSFEDYSYWHQHGRWPEKADA